MYGAKLFGGSGSAAWSATTGGRGGDAVLRGVMSLLGVGSRRRGCSLRLALRLGAVTIIGPYARGCGIGWYMVHGHGYVEM